MSFHNFTFVGAIILLSSCTPQDESEYNHYVDSIDTETYLSFNEIFLEYGFLFIKPSIDGEEIKDCIIHAKKDNIDHSWSCGKKSQMLKLGEYNISVTSETGEDTIILDSGDEVMVEDQNVSVYGYSTSSYEVFAHVQMKGVWKCNYKRWIYDISIDGCNREDREYFEGIEMCRGVLYGNEDYSSWEFTTEDVRFIENDTNPTYKGIIKEGARFKIDGYNVHLEDPLDGRLIPSIEGASLINHEIFYKEVFNPWDEMIQKITCNSLN